MLISYNYRPQASNQISKEELFERQLKNHQVNLYTPVIPYLNSYTPNDPNASHQNPLWEYQPISSTSSTDLNPRVVSGPKPASAQKSPAGVDSGNLEKQAILKDFERDRASVSQSIIESKMTQVENKKASHMQKNPSHA